jgi:predicted RNA-binding Zn-ribbon protein involved in translation (DUF1610 family)
MLKEPESIDECVYFTNRILGKGNVKVWVLKKKCPNCDIFMGKPKVKGKVKMRANEYVCEKCGKKEEKSEYEKDLIAGIQYTCPSCGNSGEMEIPFKRKRIGGIETLRFQCGKCGINIDVTKKMKERECSVGEKNNLIKAIIL